MSALERAYRRSDYAAAGAVARIGRRSAAVDAWLARHCARQGGFVGAWNPFSRRMPRGWNDRMLARLRAAARRLPQAEGSGGDGPWRERHVLLAGDPQSLPTVLARLEDSPATVVRLDTGTRARDGGDQALQQAIREALMEHVAARRLEDVHTVKDRLGMDSAVATGVRDELPAIDGLSELWGDLAAQCPFCHAHEFAGTRIGILGAAPAPHFAAMLGPIASELVVFANGEALPDTWQGGADVRQERIEHALWTTHVLSRVHGLFEIRQHPDRAVSLQLVGDLFDATLELAHVYSACVDLCSRGLEDDRSPFDPLQCGARYGSPPSSVFPD